MEVEGTRKERRGADWSVYGLDEDSPLDLSRENGNYGFGGHQPAGPNELFAGEHVCSHEVNV